MPRETKSQWDFGGELFPPQATRNILSVSQLTSQVKRLLEKQMGQVWVTGEVTNLRSQSSGHIYFTLKDPGAQLSCVLFRGETAVERELLQDGQKLLLLGDLTVYEARGQYQLIIRAVEPQGLGALQIAFEKLKARLAAEGLFGQDRKRPLPKYPQRIGLVTSPTGAAIRDVLHVVQRRNPALEIVLVPCRVQGTGAAQEIAAALRLLNQWSAQCSAGEAPDSSLDLVLLTRGGGSLEDLWAFNEEILARAIFESALPVISAVGHEIDFTISDFVADLRAATPSAAAEIVTEGVFSSRPFVAGAAEAMGRRLQQRLSRDREDLADFADRLTRAHPRRRLNEHLQRLDDMQEAVTRCAKRKARDCGSKWRNLLERLLRVRPAQSLKQRAEILGRQERRICDLARSILGTLTTRLDAFEARLRLLGPEQVLARGYSITMDARTGKAIRRAKDTRKGQLLKTRLRRGEIRSIVED